MPDKISRTAFHCENIPVDLEPGYEALDRMILKHWQDRFVSIGESTRLIICEAQSGAGKSTAICALCSLAQRNSKGLEAQVISVPYKIIGPGFSGGSNPGVALTYMGSDLDFVVGHDMTADSAQESGKADALVSLLTADRIETEDYSSRVFLCCHMTLVLAFERMRALPLDLQRKFLSHVHFAIDECHHVNGVYSDEEFLAMPPAERKLILEDRKRLGDVVATIVAADSTVRCTLASATFYRGDSTAILGPEVEEQFTKFTYSAIEYLPTTGIEDYLYDFVMWKNESDMVDKLISIIASEKDQYHIVQNPGRTHGYRKDEDDLLLKEIFSRLCDLFPDTGTPPDYDVGLGNKTILDLVTTQGRRKRKELFEKEPRKPHLGTPQFRVVMAVALVKEGTDAPCASRLHCLHLTSSSVGYGQSDGRLRRRWMGDDGKGKNKVINRQYLKDFVNVFSDVSVKELLETRIQATLLMAVKRDELCPIMLPAPMQSQDTGEDVSDMTSYFGPGVLIKIVERMSWEWESLPLEAKTKESANSIIKGVVDDYVKDPSHRKMLTKIVKARFVIMMNPYVRVPFGFGFDHSVFDKNTFSSLVTGKSGLFANLDVTALKAVDSVLMKQFPAWCAEFEKSDFLREWPKATNACSSAFRFRSSYRNYLDGIPSSWFNLYTDEIYRHGRKFLEFFNKDIQPALGGESAALNTLYKIEEFMENTGRLPIGGKNLVGVDTWYHWIRTMQDARKGIGSATWYPELHNQCCKSEILPQSMFGG